MVELIKLFMAKPLNGIISILCVVVLTTYIGLGEVRLAQATLIEQQKVNGQMNLLVLEMNDTLIRIDENVKLLKQESNRNAN